MIFYLYWDVLSPAGHAIVLVTVEILLGNLRRNGHFYDSRLYFYDARFYMRQQACCFLRFLFGDDLGS